MSAFADDRPDSAVPTTDSTAGPAPGSTAGPGPGSVRIGDSERGAAMDDLARHFSEGRLEQTEFEERTDAAMRARTAADLRPLFADLPGGKAADPATAAAAAGAERSRRAPALLGDAGEPGDRTRLDSGSTTPDHGSPAGAVTPATPARPDGPTRLRAALYAIVPLLCVAAFFLLDGAGVDNAWVAFLAIPICFALIRALDADHPSHRRREDRARRRAARRGGDDGRTNR